MGLCVRVALHLPSSQQRSVQIYCSYIAFCTDARWLSGIEIGKHSDGAKLYQRRIQVPRVFVHIDPVPTAKLMENQLHRGNFGKGSAADNVMSNHMRSI